MKHINIFKRIAATLLLAWLLADPAAAQLQISGQVLDANDRSGLIGATVVEKGTTNGTATDIEGNFTLSVSGPEAVLVVTYTGYASGEFPVNGRERIEITLGEAENVLNDVVIVGYGTQRKSDLTGAVGQVKTESIERVPTSSIEQALQGRLAGVHVLPESGEPGKGAIIRIRGTGTLNNSNPIYVIDGMITYDATFVNPQDVQSVEVLKDASSAAIYGSRGANGVIIITTKNGRQRQGDAVISLNTYYGTQSITRQVDLVNAAQFVELYNALPEVTNPYPTPADPEGTNWQNEIFREAPIGSVQLSANGGNERFSYNVSGNYFDQSGVLLNSEFKRYTVRFNSETEVKRWLKLGNNFAYAQSRRQLGPGVVAAALRMPPVFAPRDANGNFTDPTSPFGLPISNPAADLFYRANDHERGDRFFGTIYGDVKLLKYFTFRSNFGFDINALRRRTFTPQFQVSASQLNTVDRLNIENQDWRDWIWEQTLRFNRGWRDDAHRLEVLGGYTAELRRYEVIGAGRSGFPGVSDNILYVSAGNDTTQTNKGEANENALISYLFRTNYTLFNRYLFTVSGRVDQSSRFLEENRTGIFPSFGVGWNVLEEPFMPRIGWLDRLKLRFSWGRLGNQLSSTNYPSYGAITSGLYAIFGPDENINQGATLVSLGNPSLQWETTEQTDFGIELGLFGGRLTTEVDIYNRLTYEIIAGVPVPDYVGSQTDPTVNTATVLNRGMDITANWRQGGEFSWNVGAIMSPLHNEVRLINQQRAAIIAGPGETTRSEVGLPIGAFYGYKVEGIFQSAEEIAALDTRARELSGNPNAVYQTLDPQPGDLRFRDVNGDGLITGDDRDYLGSPIPTFSYGFNAAADWRGIDFAIDFFGVEGNKIANVKRLQRFGVPNWEQAFYDNRWTPENPGGTTPRITNGGGNYRPSDFFIEDGSFLRLRTVLLGYSLPRRWLQSIAINKLRLYVSGFNLWTRQEYSGYSPEFANRTNAYEVGIDQGAYPVTKSYQFGLDVTF
jgi:TonB-linked SusC/RagA family outer membrane protein